MLPDAVLDLFDPQPGQVCFDATLGRGGHAALLIPKLGPGGTYIATDLDAGNLDYARQRLATLADRHGVTLHLNHGSFADAAAILKPLELAGVDLLLADLGFASNQVDDAERGLSFMRDGPLDMRLDPADDARPTAAELVNTLPQDELADLIYAFGEERLSRRIARKIVESRRAEPIQTTGRLAHIVRPCYPRPRPRKGQRGPARHPVDPATRTFQALRIAVNGELEALDTLLAELPGLLNPGGRAGVISFHSLEDRRVKHAFLQLQQDGIGERLTRKPITADDDEAAANPRARSAKLRGFRKAD